MATTARLEEIRRNLLAAFDEGDLRTLCFDLGIDYDILSGDNKADKARELLALLDRTGRVPELITKLTDVRPNIQWREIADAAEAEPPFKGLQYFDVAEARLFFGREALTAELIGRLRNSRFLAIVGASGSGKSSVARAGVVAALQRGEPLADGARPPDGSANWLYRIFTPTSHPIEELATHLAPKDAPLKAVTQLMDDLRDEPRSLHLQARRLLADAGKTNRRLFLLVDQFEELFGERTHEDERKAFVDSLLAAVAAEDGPVIVVITLRADFYTQCARFDGLPERLSRDQEYIRAMTSSELRQAIEEPARAGGWELEPGLTDTLLKDVGDEPGALPLLSHALLETWKRRRGRTLTLQGYAEAGGLRGAIARTADVVYDSLSPEAKRIAQRIFLEVTELGEDAPDTRRRARLDELAMSGNSADAAGTQAVLQRLADARLITTDKGAEGNQTVEVAHEALIRAWPRLRGWLDESRKDLLQQRRLEDLAAQWKSKKDASLLLRGASLKAAWMWFKNQKPNSVNPGIEGFLKESRRQSQQRKWLIRIAIATIIFLLLLESNVAANVFMFYQRQDSPWQPVDFPEVPITGVVLATKVLSPTSPRICIGTNDIGIGCSLDGTSWFISQQGLPRSGPSLFVSNRTLLSALGGSTWPANLKAISGIGMDALNSERVFAIVRRDGLYRSENGGLNWELVTSAPTATLPMTSPVSNMPVRLAIQGQNMLVAFSSVTERPPTDLAYGSLFASDDSGQTWHPFGGLGSATGMTTGMINDFCLRADPYTSQLVVWVAAEKGLFSSPLGRSATWHKEAGPPAGAELILIQSGTAGSQFYVAAYDEKKVSTQLYRWQPSSSAGLEPFGGPHSDPVGALAVNPDSGATEPLWLVMESGEVFAIQSNGAWSSRGSRPGWPWSQVQHLIWFFVDQRGKSTPYLGQFDGVLAYQRK